MNFIMSLMLLTTPMGQAVPLAPPVQPAQLMHITGDIDEMVGTFVPLMIGSAGEELTIYIHSNGGYLEAAEAVVAALDARRAKGWQTKCYATKAISAAFIIFTGCDVRYAAPYGATFMMHYAYLGNINLTVGNVDELHRRLHENKKKMDKWAEDMFKHQADIMKKYMLEEKMMDGRELCKTFLGFCKVSYVFAPLEE